MAVEHNFARGDILRKVLERTNITAGRPLNLKRGGLDASHSAALLRKLRGFSRNTALLSAKLDDLIELREKQDQPPRIESWNPIKRYREHKALEKWIEAKPPSAGITSEQLEKEYPENLAEKRAFRRGTIIGAGAGGLGGGAIGALSSKGLPGPIRAIKAAHLGAIGTGVGALAGRVIGGLPYSKKRFKEHEKALKSLHESMLGPGAVSPKSLRSPVPTATKYREVTGELKKQGVGPVSRHGIAIVSRPAVWSGKNALFAPRGEKGLIITSKNVHPVVFRHEAGHARDYAYYGGEQGFRKAYPKFGDPYANRSERISSIMLPEHRAWAYAKPRTKKEKEMRKAALTTYKSALGLSSLLDQLIEFAYPEAVMKTVWNRLKKPSRKTLGGILRRHDERAPGMPTMIFREQAHMLAAKDYSTKYPKEVLETVWKKIKKPRKPSPYAQSYHSGEYHDDPKWVNKDIKKARRDARGLSTKLDEVINFQDPRPRNPLGEFSPQGSGGPDPNAMATVYKMPQPKSPGIAEGAGAALVGGALGAVGGNVGKTGWAASRRAIKHLAARRKGVSKIIKP
jgi:hypothetical protein